MVEKMNWSTPEGLEVDIIEEIRKYVKQGIPVSIGSDSMIKSDHIVFASAIGFHSFKKNVGNYFFARKNYNRFEFSTLYSRLGKEVMISIEIAKYIRSVFPEAKIEVHVDISDNPCHSSNILSDYAKAWNGYRQFRLIVKPNAWAASGCADWHTK
jgi:predicted RNase H-related nuclease YkuK (DUF458 family)